MKIKISYVSRSLIFLGLVVLFIVFVRVRLLEIPLERDEGEYAYMGQLILQGVPPYSEAYNMKFPGTYLMYALIMGLFGQSVWGIHVGLMLVNCITVILVYFLGRAIAGGSVGIMASATYAVLSLSPSVLGFAAHATHFVAVTACGGTLLLLFARRKEKYYLYFLSGLLLGVSFIMKQPGLFFILFGAAVIAYDTLFAGISEPAVKRSCSPAGVLTKKSLLTMSSFTLGAALPVLIIMLWLYEVGVFPKFWFWTVLYASKYAEQNPFPKIFSIFRENFKSVTDGFFLFWILSLAGCIMTFFHKGLRTSKGFVLFFGLFSFLSICPGFYFRNHYFITFLPAVSIFAGIAIDFLITKNSAFLKTPLPELIGAGVFITAALTGILLQKEYFLLYDPVSISKMIFPNDPFAESIRISEYLKERTNRGDRIAVLGSEPQIYFYSDRLSATGFLYAYSLTENHEYALQMQKDMISEIEAACPKFIIWVNDWVVLPASEKYIFNWINNYVPLNYRLTGSVYIFPDTPAIYSWTGENISDDAIVKIYERRQLCAK